MAHNETFAGHAPIFSYNSSNILTTVKQILSRLGETVESAPTPDRRILKWMTTPAKRSATINELKLEEYVKKAGAWCTDCGLDSWRRGRVELGGGWRGGGLGQVV